MIYVARMQVTQQNSSSSKADFATIAALLGLCSPYPPISSSSFELSLVGLPVKLHYSHEECLWILIPFEAPWCFL